MKKNIAISALGIAGVVGVTATSYLISDKKGKVKQKKITNKTFENAGVPDQSSNNDMAQLENAQMVSEGSQFGIHYYNEKKEDNTLDNQQNY
ncbi:hypothetical protein [Oceanobacillus bengalensis]|uniref:Uncharacterized protein n=1 Tax=Oceanobacillus bengalensis TaxID=1435466 RepID=A0A494YSV8_9BACI|nr:hypothetical protein [Oceanobacillus bengalensis]RKQ13210.1 hypothetical protein D8M05_17075 [Oceanobacillus bengalensis]